ncbi:hypothetical protein ACQ5SO_08620 [Rhodovulum sp. DZ06]|uniref:hypothetical protein n=1 Tax=Rhodovulum sp. DZ06 TaxID=3425126 RepID=UPI003D338EBC
MRLIGWALRALWAGACLYAAGIAALPAQEALLSGYALMLLPNAPASLLVSGAWGGLAMPVPGGGALMATGLFAATAAAGYAQWFILVPWAVRRLLRRPAAGARSGDEYDDMTTNDKETRNG